VTVELVDFRCPECDRLICKVTRADGIEVEAVCPRSSCRKKVRAQLVAADEE